MAFLTRIRIQKALILLKQTDRTVTEIAGDTGFDSLSGFYSAFKKSCRTSPGRCRLQLQHKSEKSNTAEKLRNPEEAENSLAGYADTQDSFIRKVWNMTVSVKELPGWDIAFVRRIGSYLDADQEHWPMLAEWAGKNGLHLPKALFIGLSLDDPAVVPEKECRHDACVTLPETFDRNTESDANPGIRFGRIEKGLFGVSAFTTNRKSWRSPIEACIRSGFPTPGIGRIKERPWKSA